jgi:hypothetical protein
MKPVVAWQPPMRRVLYALAFMGFSGMMLAG